MPNFECRYHLENYDLYIIEIKRTDLDNDAPIADRFKWLKINKETLEITQLNFASMDSAGEIEERYFEEGYLKFDSKTGTFIEKYNSGQHALERKTDLELPDNLINSITESINALRLQAR